MAIFIPKKINVGFQKRQGTYTEKLAYIIYFDEKGKLRKETSWNSWRHDDIPTEIADNEPTSGFVLNKRAGGYSTGWNHRQTYIRVYDPRGYEFEISVSNLLYILENTTSTKGKGLEGEFVYGWDGTELILIPTESPDYEELTKINDIIHAKEHIKGKDLKIGATYLTRDNKELIFMGKFEEYRYGTKKKGKSFFFYNEGKYSGFQVMKSIGQKIVSVASEDCVENYADLFAKLECQTSYSPVDDSQDEYVPYTKEEIEKKYERYSWGGIYIEGGKRVELRKDNEGGYYYNYENPNRKSYNYWNSPRNINPEPYYLQMKYKDAQEVVEKLKPLRLRKFLANGKVYSEGF